MSDIIDVISMLHERMSNLEKVHGSVQGGTVLNAKSVDVYEYGDLLIFFKRYRQQKIEEDRWGVKTGWAISTWSHVDDPGRSRVRGVGYFNGERSEFTVKNWMDKLQLHIEDSRTNESFDRVYSDVYRLVEGLNANFPQY